jgi:WD40 repeat protein
MLARLWASRAVPPTDGPRYDAFLSYGHDDHPEVVVAVDEALRSIGRPWNRLRAMRTFRDANDLSVGPDLPQAIREAIGASRYFVLFASPATAESEWVHLEVEHWLDIRGADADTTLVIVLLAGEFPAVLPAVLRERLSITPNYVDLRWAAGRTDLSVEEQRLHNDVATISARILQLPKDVLVNDDHRQLRRRLRRTRAAVVTLALLSVISLVATAMAWSSTKDARQQAELATTQRNLALSRQMAAQAGALTVSHPDVARQLAVLAWRTAPTFQARQSLLGAVSLPVEIRPLERTSGAIVLSTGQVLLNDQSGVHLWSLRGGGGPTLTVGENWSGTTVAASADGRLVAFESDDNAIMIYDTAHPSRPSVVLHPAGRVSRHMAFSPDGRYLAINLDDRLTLWEPSRPEAPVASLAAPRSYALAFSPDGRRVAFGNGAAITVRELARLDVPYRDIPFVGTASVLAFDTDGTRLAVGTEKDSAYVWDLSSAAREPTHTLVGRNSNGYIDALGFSPDGRSLAGGSTAGSVWVWALEQPDVPKATYISDTNSHVLDVEYTADGSRLAVVREANVQVYSISHRNQPVALLSGATEAVHRVTLSPDGELIAAASLDRAVRVWRRSRPTEAPIVLSAAGMDFVPFIAFDPSGTRLATAGNSSTQIWNLDRPTKPEFTLASASAVAFMPDGRRLISGDNDGRVHLWDLTAPAAPATTFPPFSNPPVRAVRALSVTPEGRVIASSEGSPAVLLDLGQPDRVLGGVTTSTDSFSGVRSAAISVDGSRVAIGDQNGTVDLLDTNVEGWDNTHPGSLLVKAPLAHLTGHNDIISAIALGAGDDLAVAAGNRIFLWSSSNPEEPLGVLTDDSEYVADLAFSQDGTTLASVGAGHDVLLWNLDPQSISARVCSAVQTPLSTADWQRYLPDQHPETIC